MGVEADGLDLKTLHLGTRNFNDSPFSGAHYGISICGKRITDGVTFVDDVTEACLQCRMIISEFIGDPD